MTDTFSSGMQTQRLLRCGMVAGPLYVAVSLAQALTREGFDLSRHPWSLLANGDLGWIQITNFVVSGLLVVAFALGLRIVLGGGRGGTWGPWLIGLYGLSLVAAGLFRADPAMGFPVGSPAVPTSISTHGIVHFAAGGVGFTGLAIACFIVATRYAAEGRPGWAWFGRATGGLFLLGFMAIASGGGSAMATLAFTGAMLLVWTWIACVANDRSRTATVLDRVAAATHIS